MIMLKVDSEQFKTPMSIDDRDYMRDRNGASDMEARRFRTSEQQKARQVQVLKNRFARYSGSSHGLAAPKVHQSRFFLIALVLVIGAMIWTRWSDIPARFLTRFAAPHSQRRARFAGLSRLRSMGRVMWHP